MKKVFGYCRVSSEEQAAHGISISAQRDILNGYAAMSQSQITIFEDPGFSGKNTNRPALQRMLSAIRPGEVDAIVVWKLDRLSRSLRDTLTMIEDIFQPAGVALVSVTESIDTSTPSGRMMLNLLASFAQLEREQDSDRVVMAHKHLAQDCKYLGGHVPLGYCIDEMKHFQLDPVTSPIVRRVFELYLSRSGYSAILEYLNSPPVFPSTGKKRPYGKSDITFMLKNEIYAGTYVRHMGADKRHPITNPETIRVPGGVPAILSPNDWTRVCAIRKQRVELKTGAIGKARTVYPLSGLVHCAVCGNLMYLNHGGKARDGTIERYYTCKQKCVRPARLEKLQDAVYAALNTLASDPELIRQACRIADQFSASREQDNQHEILHLEKRLKELSKQTAHIIAFVKVHGAASPASMMTELQELEKEENDLKSRISYLKRPISRYDTEKMIKSLQSTKDIKKYPPEEVRALIQAGVHRINVSNTEYQILPAWHLVGGDEPPHPICHVIPR